MSVRTTTTLLACALVHSAAALADEGCDVARGESVYTKCAVCHPVEAGAPHGAGPNLRGVVGRAVGEVEGFRFSKPMRKSGASWTVEHLDAFLENPAEVYARTRMAFAGLRKAEDRAAVICYLESLASAE